MSGFARSTLAAVLAAAALAACSDEPRPPARQPDPPVEPDDGVPHLTLSADALRFEADEAQSPPPQAFTVGNSGGGVLATPILLLGEFWLDAEVAWSAAGYVVTVAADPTGLAPGRHEAELTVYGNADNSPLTVAVALDVAPASPGSVASVEILSGGFLLTATGEGYRPLARAYDALGRQVNAAITWRSSAPEVVDFDARGIAWAGAARGAAVVTAEAGGVDSPPIVAVVAQPAEGLEVVGDDDLSEVPGPADARLPVAPGWRFDAHFHGEVPYPVGTLIATRGRLAFAGRVISSRKGECGPSQATLEVVPLEELLPGLSFSLVLPLAAGASPAVAGPVTCADGAVSLTGATLDGSGLELAVDYAGGLRALRLGGRITAEVDAEVSLPAGFGGSVDCRTKPVTYGIAWPGALQLALPSQLTLGAGLSVSGETSGPVQASPGVSLAATAETGLRVEGETAVFGGAHTLEAVAELNATPAQVAYRVELRPHARAELAVGFDWSPASRASVFTLRAGEVAAVDWAPMDDQASLPPRPSSWALAGFADVEPGPDPVSALGAAASLTGVRVDPGHEALLWRSATGTLTASPARLAAGGTAELVVALDPLVSPAGQTPAPSIAVVRRTAAGLVPVCTVPAAATDPRVFSCTATFPDAAAGARVELHAFALDPGGALPTELAGAATFIDVE